MFLLVGEPSDMCIRQVSEMLHDAGDDARVVSPATIIAHGFAWYEGGTSPQQAMLRLVDGAGGRLEGILLRHLWFGRCLQFPNNEDQQYADYETSTGLSALFAAIALPVINRPHFAYPIMEHYTPLDLGDILHANDLASQEMLVTTRLAMALDFVRKNEGQALVSSIFDPTARIAVTLAEAEAEFISLLQHGPVCLSQRLKATAVRAFVVDNQVYAERAVQPWLPKQHTVDRALTQFVPVVLPPDLSAQCCGVTTLLGLTFGQLSLAETVDGQYICCGVSPLPDYSMCQAATQSAITHALIRILKQVE
ncbi:MAG: hypothetical protein H0X37_16310 [Herpetosiphonaceae bacterium]|nr:hypothetical protein [Herpetosiphonaceae bacterium]